ncbi:MAG: hypothetical protein GWN13_25740, partial [Phycisphaerae bacterium]|nr:hypothetical protein [Phycisphaerae bacterium]
VDNDNRYVYRGLDNTKCAAGFLIPDDHLATDFRGSWDEVTDRFGDLYSKYNDLIYDLQLAHDYAAMEQMQGYDFVER